MKHPFTILIISFILATTKCIGQTKFTEQKAGHLFYISLPEYVNKTVGLNDVASIQYKNSVKDVYGIVIEDCKEELAMLDIHYASINEFCEEFANDFLKDEEQRKVSTPSYQTKDKTNFAEYDISFFDKTANTEIYYLVGIAETKTHFYKILSWTLAENKEKYKTDFQKILYSLKD